MCWEAFTTHSGAVYGYTLSNSFTSYSGGLGTDCNACVYEHGGGCLIPPATFVPGIVTSCCDEVTTMNISVPSTSNAINIFFMVFELLSINDRCYQKDNKSSSVRFLL